MGIEIPGILAGGVGRAIQGVGQGVLQAGAGIQRVVSQVEKNVEIYDNQQALIEASRIENDMLLAKKSSYDSLSKTDDGTDSQFVTKLRNEDERIGNQFIASAKNEKAKNYLIQAHQHSQKLNTMKAQSEQQVRLWNTSLENIKIQTDNVIRRAAPYADYDNGIRAVDEYVQAQTSFFGADTANISTAMKQRFAENMVRASLSDPITAPVMLRKLEDEKEKRKIFENIPIERLDSMESAIKTAKQFQESIKKDAEYDKRAVKIAMKEAREEAQEVTRNKFVERYADTRLQETEILKSNLDAKEKKYWLEEVRQQRKAREAQAATGDPLKTDKVLEADLYKMIVEDPEGISEPDILRFVGSRLTKDAGKGLVDERRRILNGDTDPGRHEASKAVLRSMERDRKNGIFGDEAEGEIEYAKQVQSFKRWLRKNPDKEPTEYYEKIMEPVKGERLFGFLEGQNPGRQRTEMEKTGEIPKAGKKQMIEKPSAADHVGRVMRDTETGKRFKSDGKDWIEVQ